jgi:SAM-dependent methyltransferase
MSEPTYDQFKQRYATDQAAQKYRDRRFTMSRRWRRIDRREQEIVAEFLITLPRAARVLDIPCGAGRLAPLVRQAGAYYVGADVSLHMLALARKAVDESAGIVAADALRLPFADAAFDAALCVRLMHRIEEPDGRAAILRELARVARGPLLVSYYLSGNLRGLGKRLRGRFPGLNAAAIRDDAARAGLAVIRATPIARWTEQQWFLVFERQHSHGAIDTTETN